MDFTIEHLFTAVGSSGVAVATGALMFSKLRRTMTHDSVDVASHKAMKVTMDALLDQVTRLQSELSRQQAFFDSQRAQFQSEKAAFQSEIARIHAESARQQQAFEAENTRLHILVSSLQSQLDKVNEALRKNDHLDDLARKGVIDRRRREGIFDSRSQPGPLPDIDVPTE